LEEEKIRTRKENAALARLIGVGKRRKGIIGGKRSTSMVGNGNGVNMGRTGSGGSRTRTRSTSPIKDSETEGGVLIRTEAASSENSPVLGLGGRTASTGLKRTRSNGMGLGLGISTVIANSLGSGGLGVGSPLKAFIGADEGEGEGEGGDRVGDVEGAEKRLNKKSRLSDDGEDTKERRLNSVSPSLTAPLPGLGAAKGGVKGRRASSNLSVEGGDIGGLGMRRVVSATSLGAGGERVKREVRQPVRYVIEGEKA